MRLIVLVTSALLAALDRHPAAARCDTLAIECRNGLFNRETCQCDCIKPFCRDAAGECSVPTSNCGGNPWAECEKGRSCPWWPSTLTAESCTTGPNVPAGVWEIHETRARCCERNFPGSDWCVPETELEAASSPTKYPTIVVEEDDIEVVPLRFDLVNVPEAGLSLSALKAEMTTILKRVLVRLSERVDVIRITKVEETVRAKYSARGLREVERRRDVTMYFDVHVVRVDGMRFGPIIVQEIQDSYSEITRDIRSYSDENLLGSDLTLNLCTSRSGKFNNCISDEPLPVYEKDNSSNDAGVSNPTVLAEPTGQGLAGWAVALIILAVLALLFCIGGLVVWWYRREEDDIPREKHVYNNVYYPTGSMPRKPRRATTNSTYQDSARGRSRSQDHHRDGRGRAPQRPIRHEPRMYEPTTTPDTSDSTEAETAIDLILSETSREDPTFDDEHFSINTYTTRNKRVGRDPTMYIPGREDRPDPEAGGGQLVVVEDGEDGRRYHEDPPLRVKRDPSSYEPTVGTAQEEEEADSRHSGSPREPSTEYYGEGGLDASESHGIGIYPISEEGSLRQSEKIDDSVRSNRSSRHKNDRSDRSGYSSIDDSVRSNRSSRDNIGRSERSGYSSSYGLPEMMSGYDLSFVTKDPSHGMNESSLTNDMEDMDESYESYHVSFKTEVPRSAKKKRRSRSKQKSFPI